MPSRISHLVRVIGRIPSFFYAVLLFCCLNYLSANQENDQYYLDLQTKPVFVAETNNLKVKDILRNLFVSFNDQVHVTLLFEPESLGENTINLSSRKQTVKNHLLFICSSIGAKFEMTSYPPTLKIIKVTSAAPSGSNHKLSQSVGIEKWKENIHQRQMLLYPEKFQSEDVISFAKKQIAQSDLFRVDQNQQGVVPNELLAIKILCAMEEADTQLRELFHQSTDSGKLYCIAALRLRNDIDLTLEETLRRSNSYVGFQDSKMDLIGAKKVSWILDNYILRDKISIH